MMKDMSSQKNERTFADLLEKDRQPRRKMTKVMTRNSQKRRMNGKFVRCLISLKIREINKVTMRYNFIPIRLKNLIIPSFVKDMS